MMPFMDAYIIYDSRRIHGKNKKHMVDIHRAQEIMRTCVYKESESLRWALDEKLGVIVDSWYVPLVTASPGLLLKFEEN